MLGFTHSDRSIIERLELVSDVQSNLIQGYLRDFGKYSDKVDATLIESVFRNIPSQLSSVFDDSVKRFKFKGVHQRKSRYAEYESAITWLHKCRLTLKNYLSMGNLDRPYQPIKRECYKAVSI